MKKLNLASQLGDLDAVKKLIEHDGIDVNGRADINCSNGFHLENSTALHQACQNLHFYVAEYLLKKGANVNAQAGREKYTPLHALAVNYFSWSNVDRGYHQPSQKMAKLLIANGADLMLRLHSDAGNLTPLGCAEKHDTKSIIPILIEAESNDQLTVEHEKHQGLLSVRRMGKVLREQAVSILIDYIHLEDQRITIPEDVEVAFDFYTKSIRVACPANTGGNSDDLPDNVSRVIRNVIPKDAITTKLVYSEESTGFGGLCTYKGRHILVTDVDIEKLQQCRDQKIEALQAQLAIAEQRTAQLKNALKQVSHTSTKSPEKRF